MASDLEQAKRSLRTELRDRRRSLTEDQRAAAASALGERLDALVDDFAAGSISCFVSTRLEPGTREFIDRAVGRGIRVLLPVTRADGLLDWVLATEDPEIAEGRHGLGEPVGPVLGADALDEVDLMIVPAAAVDRTGMRMGWGQGYFDRTLGSMRRRPPVYAVLYDSEVLHSLPREVHDQPVNGVVTPSQTLHLSPVRR